MLLRAKVKNDKMDGKNENFYKEVESINNAQVDIHNFKNYNINSTLFNSMKLGVNWTEKKTE